MSDIFHRDSEGFVTQLADLGNGAYARVVHLATPSFGSGIASSNNQIRQILMAGLADAANWIYELVSVLLVTKYKAVLSGTGFVAGDSLEIRRLVSYANTLTSPTETVSDAWFANGSVLAVQPNISQLSQTSAELVSECKLQRSVKPDISTTLAPQVRTIKFSVARPGLVLSDSQWQ